VIVVGIHIVNLVNRHAAHHEILNGINRKHNIAKDKVQKSSETRKVARGMLSTENQKLQREAAVVPEIEIIKSLKLNNNS
jgi:hypothetical protein